MGSRGLGKRKLGEVGVDDFDTVRYLLRREMEKWPPKKVECWLEREREIPAHGFSFTARTAH